MIKLFFFPDNMSSVILNALKYLLLGIWDAIHKHIAVAQTRGKHSMNKLSGWWVCQNISDGTNIPKTKVSRFTDICYMFLHGHLAFKGDTQVSCWRWCRNTCTSYLQIWSALILGWEWGLDIKRNSVFSSFIINLFFSIQVRMSDLDKSWVFEMLLQNHLY